METDRWRLLSLSLSPSHLGVGEGELSHGVAAVAGLLGHLHKQVSMLFQLLLRPILHTHLLHRERERHLLPLPLPPSLSHLSLLLILAEHEDAGDIVFPHHPPEVVDCGLHGSLRQDVLMPVLVPLAQHLRERERGGSIIKS